MSLSIQGDTNVRSQNDPSPSCGTRVDALTAAGHAIAGRHVHVLSVNDYLAEQDATWMRPLNELMGVSVGSMGEHTTADVRRRAYRGDVVYAPVSEVGFDVLRDRFAVAHDERVMPRFDTAVVDEADAVMIDDAMVPLVLAGSAAGAANDFDAAYDEAAQFMQTLGPADMTRQLDDLGLRRPSATWAYMVTDDPFGTTGDRLTRELGRLWRRTVLRTD